MYFLCIFLTSLTSELIRCGLTSSHKEPAGGQFLEFIIRKSEKKNPRDVSRAGFPPRHPSITVPGGAGSLALGPAWLTRLLDSRQRESLIFSSEGGSTQPSRLKDTPPPQLTDTLPNPRWRRPLHLSLRLRPRYLCPATRRSDPSESENQEKTNYKPNPDTYISCRFLNFGLAGATGGRSVFSRHGPNYCVEIWPSTELLAAWYCTAR